MELSGYSKTISTCKTFISDFRFGWPKVRSMAWTPIIRYLMKKKKTIPSHTHQIRSIYPEWRMVTGAHHLRSPTIFANNLRLKKARDVKVIPLCLSRHSASTDMQLDLLGSSCDIDRRSNFDLIFQAHHAYVLTRREMRSTIVPELCP